MHNIESLFKFLDTFVQKLSQEEAEMNRIIYHAAEVFDQFIDDEFLDTSDWLKAYGVLWSPILCVFQESIPSYESLKESTQLLAKSKDRLLVPISSESPEAFVIYEER